MKLLCLDISTCAGWAVIFSGEDQKRPTLGLYGLIQKEKPAHEYGQYPSSYRRAAKAIADQLITLIHIQQPDVVVIEETNQNSSSRYSQKLLEWIHLYVGQAWDDGSVGRVVEQLAHGPGFSISRNMSFPELVYISTGTWKHALGLKKPKEAKRGDQLLKQARVAALKAGPDGTSAHRKALNAEKKRLGIRGKWNKKMLAVNYVNTLFSFDWKLKQNDVAEAICLGLAHLAGAQRCDGNPSGKGNDG